MNDDKIINNIEKLAIKSFTRTGDRGTSLIGHDQDGMPIRIDKDSLMMQFWGDCDLLSSWLGCIENRSFRNIQTTIYKISGYLYNKEVDTDYLKKQISKMEKFCEKREGQLSTEFILPQGKSHFARALCRKTERTAVSFAKSSQLDGIWLVVKYFNRLSSYLFVYAESDFDEEI